jgi:hypothetical protein
MRGGALRRPSFLNAPSDIGRPRRSTAVPGANVHNHHRDILDRLAEPPSWFDDHGVPRYEPFAPADLANIYADEAALAEVSCQGFGRQFRVALTGAFADRGLSLGDAIRLRRVEYPDGLPPDIAAREEIWAATAKRLSTDFSGCRRVEFLLAHSRPMLDDSDAVTDAGRPARAAA